jgi:Rrf2 family protein
MQLKRATEYAIHFLAALAADETGGRMSTQVVASSLKIPLAALQKLLGRLARAHILQTARGFHGGCRLIRPPHKMSLLEIVDLVEGPPTNPRSAPWRPKDTDLDRRITEAIQEADAAGRAQLARVRLSELMSEVRICGASCTRPELKIG